MRGCGASEAGSVVGRVAAHDLVPGTLLVAGELSSAPSLAPGQAVVGLAVKDGDLPADLAPEEHVEVIATPSESTGGGSSTAQAGAGGSSSVGRQRRHHPRRRGGGPVRHQGRRRTEHAGVGGGTLGVVAPAVTAANAAGAVSLVLIAGGP